MVDVDEKAFLEGFLQYLRAYYGSPERKAPNTEKANQPRIPMFESSSAPSFPQETGMDMGMAQGLGMQQPQQVGQALNQMFPQPMDPRKLN